MNIDFGPQIEGQIVAIAKQIGMAPADVVKQVVIGKLPALPQTPEISDRNRAAIAILQSWRDEDKTDDLEEVRRAEDELAEFKRNIDANRVESGDHPVYS
jgi:hypothetical protein